MTRRSRNPSPAVTLRNFVQVPYQLLGYETRRHRTPGAVFLRRALIAVAIVLATLYFLAPINLSSSSDNHNSKSRSRFKLPPNGEHNKNGSQHRQPLPLVLGTQSPGVDYCPIPKIPTRTTTLDIQKILTKTGIKIPRCSEHYKEFSEFTEDQEGLKLINFNTNGNDAVYSDCCVYEISRPQLMKTDSYVISDCTLFSSSGTYTPISPTTEYFIVKCHHTQSNTSKFNYHARVLTTVGSIGAKVDYWKEKTRKLDTTKTNQHPLPLPPPNVLVLVLDSTSSQDAYRQLPKTMKYLLESMDFIQFKKYVVLGEPTMENAIPLLLGKRTKDFFVGRKWDEYWDSEDFVWKAFNSTGFVTGYTEDIPDLGTFNYGGQIGFQEAPTDVYMRPFFLAREELTDSDAYGSPLANLKAAIGWSETVDICLGPKHHWNIIYDYHIQLLKKLHKKAPVFQMPWLCWPFHDHFGTLEILDQDTLRFFQQIEAEPQILDNTLIMVLGDHGFYASSEYSNTKVGLLERRLPLFMIRLPQNLLLKNPELLTIVKSNSQTVTTHYDTYQTLLELSNFQNHSKKVNGANAKTHGQSLFKLLPKNRTCEDAHIPETWCPCGLPQSKSNGKIPSEYEIHKVHSFEKIMSQHPMAKSTFFN